MTASPAPAAMPSEEEIARALIAYFVENTGFQTVNEDDTKTSVAAYYGGNWIDLRIYPMARAILDLFAPILAEKEREIASREPTAFALELGRKLAILTDRADAAEARALAAESALAAAREEGAREATERAAKIAEADSHGAGARIAAAIRAQGE